MKLDRYPELINFWKNTEGLWISDDDSCENLKIFLKRNPRLNFIAVSDNKIVGTLKCSHDGRRGYLHHLAVKKEFRKEGIAKELINKCLDNLQAAGITKDKVRVFVLDSNKSALAFWQHAGFEEQTYDYRTFELKKELTK
jgi:ribosomal protein S18 acetylase RimI-like enzyme